MNYTLHFVGIFNFVLILLLVNSQNQYTTVERCPGNETSWSLRSKTVECKSAGQRYHCMISSDDQFAEVCLEPRAYNTTDGCPYLKIENGSYKIEKSCKNTTRKCQRPGTNVGIIVSHLLFNFPECLVLKEEDTSSARVYTIDDTNQIQSTPFLQNEDEEQNTATSINSSLYMSYVNGIQKSMTTKGLQNAESKEVAIETDKGNTFEWNIPMIAAAAGLVLVLLGFGIPLCLVFKRVKMFQVQLHGVRYSTAVSRSPDTNAQDYSEITVYDDVLGIGRTDSIKSEDFYELSAPGENSTLINVGRQSSPTYEEPHDYIEVIPNTEIATFVNDSTGNGSIETKLETDVCSGAFENEYLETSLYSSKNTS